MTSPSEDKLEGIYLNRKDLMNHFNIRERRTIDSWIKINNFPEPVMFGGILRWKVSEVAMWSANRSSGRDKQDKEQSDE